jgi:hypothetical protein
LGVDVSDDRNAGPGGIVWSHDDVATTAEIVACFDQLSATEIRGHNWGTCSKDCPAQWNVTKETYINGVMMTLDYDFHMGYLIECVDRTSSQLTYVAIVQYHGRREDGTFRHDFASWPNPDNAKTEFFDRGFLATDVKHWAVDAIEGMIEAHEEALKKDRT